MSTVKHLNRDTCRWGKKECPFTTCKEEIGVKCSHWSPKPFKPNCVHVPDVHEDFNSCCNTVLGSQHRITCPNSRHKNATWRNRDPRISSVVMNMATVSIPSKDED